MAQLQETNRLEQPIKKATQSFRWAEELPVAEFKPNVLFCLEQTRSQRGDPLRIADELCSVSFQRSAYRNLTQLILHGSLIQTLAESFGSAKNFARRLAESMHNHLVPPDLPLPGQICFRPP